MIIKKKLENENPYPCRCGVSVRTPGGSNPPDSTCGGTGSFLRAQRVEENPMPRYRQTRNRRRRLLDKDPRCQYCLRPLTLDTSTLDHIVPRCAGGANETHNFALVCRKCNHRKGGDLPSEISEWAARIVAIAGGI